MRIIRLAALVVGLFLVTLAMRPASQGVTFQKGEDRIDVLVDGKPFTTYYYAASQPRPFFHPLRSADGRVITRGYPMIANAPGEEKDHDHPHHRSCWFTHGDVDGVDYWGEAGKVPRRIVNRSVDMKKDGRK